MNIALDISPLESGHKVRGVGFYIEHLKESLLKQYPDHAFDFITKDIVLPASADIVHYPYFDPYFLTLPLIKSKPTVVTVHDLITVKFPTHFPPGLKGAVKWQIQKRSLLRAEAIIVDSQASKDDLVEIVGVASEKVHVVYLAAASEFSHTSDKKKRAAVLKKYNLPEKFLLYVGDATWNKNLPNIVSAIKHVDMPIVMVGKALTQENVDKTNPWNHDLVWFQNKVKDDALFIRLGFVPTEDLYMLYNTATLLVMPSKYEGFGLPVIEAMQSGCPVLTAKNGSLPEVGGDAVRYVDADNVDDIARGIKDVVKNKKLLDGMSEKGLQQAKKFSWKRTAEQTMHIYESVLKMTP